MADTIREQIIAAFETALEAFSFTILSNPTIERGVERIDPDVKSLPFISILPRPDSGSRNPYGYQQIEMQVDLSCCVQPGTANRSTLGEAILGELIEASFSSVPSLASKFYYLGGGVDQYQDTMGHNSMIVGCSIMVVFETVLHDPYTAG